MYARQDTRNAKKPTGTKQKKKGMTIKCKTEQMTTHTNLGTDYSSGGDKTKHLVESSCSENEGINNAGKELLNKILSLAKTNKDCVNNKDTNKASKPL